MDQIFKECNAVDEYGDDTWEGWFDAMIEAQERRAEERDEATYGYYHTEA